MKKILLALLSILLIIYTLTIHNPAAADGTYDNPGTTDALDCSADCITWSQSPVWIVDKFGKFIITTQSRSVVTHFAFSNDEGDTWTQSTEGYSFLTRGSMAYDSINDVIHIIWSATAASDGIIYRRYSISRDGSNNITSIQRMNTGVNLQLDTSASRSFEHPIALWVDDGSTDGILVALWTKSGSNLVEVRASMRRLSMTDDDGTAGNWIPLDGSADTFSTDPPAVDADKIFGSTSNGSIGVAAKIRGGSGAHKDDLYIFPAIALSGGGTDAVQAHRLTWDSGDNNWSGGTSNLGTLGTIVNGSGYNLKHQLITKPVIDSVNDRLYVGWARWKDNTAGDTVSFAYLDSSDSISSVFDTYSANGTHSYAPTFDLSYDNTGNKLYIAYILSTTNGDNGSIDYKTFDGSSLSSNTRFYTTPGGTGGEDGSADIPQMMADRHASNDRIYIGFRVNGALPPTALDPHTLELGYIQLSAVTPTPTPTTAPLSSSSSSSSSSNGTCTNSSPLAGADLFRIDASDTKATLYFSPAQNPVTGYNIVYGLTPGERRYSAQYNHTANGVMHYTVNELMPNTSYYFRVFAKNGCSGTVASNEVKVTTQKKNVRSEKTYFKGDTQSTRQAKPSSATCGQQYTVRVGDSLWNIAKLVFGSGNLYMKLLEANAESVQNARLIRVSQILKIPC